MSDTDELLGAELSPRELQLLHGLAAGHTLGGLAAQLYVAESTVKTFREHLYRKLGARSAAHAVALAHRRGILHADPDVVAAANVMRGAHRLGYRLAVVRWEDA